MFGKLLATSNDLTLTLVRLALSVTFFAHGAQKMLGWYGGYGFHGTMGFFTQQVGIPAPLAFSQSAPNSSAVSALFLAFSPASPR